MTAWRKGSFVTVPNREIVIKLKGSALQLYIALCYHADDNGSSFPSVKTLADELDLSERSIQQGRVTLETAGVLQVSMQKRPDGSSRSNRYQIQEVVNQFAPTTEPEFIPLTKTIESQLPNGSSAGAEEPPKDEILRLIYLVVKKYQLPVMNHSHVPKWASTLREAYPDGVAELYLTRLVERDLNAEARDADYVPQLGKSIDIVQKAGMIMQYFKRTKGRSAGASTGHADDYYARMEEKARRIREGQ